MHFHTKYLNFGGMGTAPFPDPTPSAPTAPNLRAFGGLDAFGVLVPAPRWLNTPPTVKILATSLIVIRLIRMKQRRLFEILRSSL